MARRSLCRLLVAVVLIASANAAWAAPQVNNVSLRGLQIGGSTTITFDGGELLPAPLLIAPFPISRQTVLPGATAARVQIEVSLAETVSPGVYPLRLANASGISNVVFVGIDRLPQLPLAANVGTLPVALHGAINGSEIQRVSFSGKKDERVVVDVESRRLGANLKPVVRVYDARGRQIAWSLQKSSISGDARCETVLPADGAYTIELHDLLYRAAAPSFFRLKIGALTYADLAFPVGVEQGKKSAISFALGNLPADAQTEFDATAAIPFPQHRPVAAASSALFTGEAPRVFISGHAEVAEIAQPARQPHGVELIPVGLSGRIAKPEEEDKYQLTVAPGAKLRFDVQARRIGSPLDAVLTVQGEKGEQPMSNDDRPGVADPGFDYAVPGDVGKLLVSLRDLQRKGGADFVYRIAVTDLARPDFGLSIDVDRINVSAGGSQFLRVQVERRGYNGPIKLSALGLPMTVQLSGAEIPSGATQGLLTLTAAPGEPTSGLATIVGTTVGSEPPVSCAARLPETPATRGHVWQSTELGFAVSQPAPLGLVWVPGSAEEKLQQGGKLSAKLQVTRAEGVAGAIRVQLLTTQPMPKKTIKENNQDKQVDDVDRALRLEAVPMFAVGTNEGAANILVPADLPSGPWTLVLVAELLAADGKTVVASVAAPARTLAGQNPLAIELTSTPLVEGKAGLGETGKFTGKIVRSPGFAQAVTVSLSGLPQGVPAPKVEVPAEQTDFSLTVSFPYGTKPAELKGLKLAATAVTDPKVPTLTVRSNEVLVGVNIVPGEKPAEGAK